MVSTYEYTTAAALASIHSKTYASIDAAYTATVVEANITQAERWVNEYCGRENTGFSAPIPDGVVFATLEMAKYLMEKLMLEDGHLEELTRTLSDVLKICKEPLSKHKPEISYSASRTDFDLRLLEW